jgi:hypothetical protein
MADSYQLSTMNEEYHCVGYFTESKRLRPKRQRQEPLESPRVGSRVQIPAGGGKVPF